MQISYLKNKQMTVYIFYVSLVNLIHLWVFQLRMMKMRMIVTNLCPKLLECIVHISILKVAKGSKDLCLDLLRVKDLKLLKLHRFLQIKQLYQST